MRRLQRPWQGMSPGCGENEDKGWQGYSMSSVRCQQWIRVLQGSQWASSEGEEELEIAAPGQTHHGFQGKN